ncbi:transcriptional repressor [Candidatus Gracilibacteria bacterium]|nr:transcriptional repressor [Candidatus Gracilibacteria bacterium]
MNIETVLKNHGKSITEERKEIFSFLETKHIFSAQDVHEHFKELGRASIFRTIKLFLEIGIIRRLNIGERGDSYEINHAGHHHEHMKCTLCQKIMSFDSHAICKKIFEEAKKQGFIIQEHSLSILGKCEKCAVL